MKEANKKGRHLLTKSFIKRHYKMLEKFKKSIKYLKCDIQPGMYSSEKTISFENSKGNTISGFSQMKLLNKIN